MVLLSWIFPVCVPVTLHDTSNVVPYWVWIVFVVVTLHQWSANFFIAAQITFSIAIEGSLHSKPLEQNESLLNNNIDRLYNKMACN